MTEPTRKMKKSFLKQSPAANLSSGREGAERLEVDGDGAAGEGTFVGAGVECVFDLTIRIIKLIIAYKVSLDEARLCYNRIMKKLIVKSRLVDRAAFDQQIAGIGMELSPVIWQHERIYLPHDYRPAMNFPRLVMRTEVRTTEQPATYAMYLKRHIEDSGIDWVNYTAVQDYTEATGIVHQLGFRKVAEISRQRQELRLDDRTIIYIDMIEGIEGTFLKIEADLDENESVDALRADLWAILTMLGLETFNMQPYFDLIQNAEQPYLIPRANA